MISKNSQAAAVVTMIRPHQFYPNAQTAADNSFQNVTNPLSKRELAGKAYQQVTDLADKLKLYGVQVLLFEDTSNKTPDSVFPNNWFSTHNDNRVVIYPMYPVNRRKERREDIINNLKSNFKVKEVVDYSGQELDDIFLEGTGVMVLDHIERIAYAARSKRISSSAFAAFCRNFKFYLMRWMNKMLLFIILM